MRDHSRISSIYTKDNVLTEINGAAVTIVMTVLINASRPI